MRFTNLGKTESRGVTRMSTFNCNEPSAVGYFFSRTGTSRFLSIHAHTGPETEVAQSESNTATVWQYMPVDTEVVVEIWKHEDNPPFGATSLMVCYHYSQQLCDVDNPIVRNHQRPCWPDRSLAKEAGKLLDFA